MVEEGLGYPDISRTFYVENCITYIYFPRIMHITFKTIIL